MKFVWHIFLKDLRRLRLPLAGWIGLFVLQYIGFVLLPQWPSPDDRTPPLHSVVHGALWGLELVVAWLLVGQLLHDDPLVGELAAWRTRPISPRRLLAAKALGGFLLLCVLPTLLLIPWWVHFGFGPAEILVTAAANVIGFALFLSLAALVAVLTADLLRFIGWSLLLAIGVGLLLLIVANASAVVGDEGIPAALLITRLWLGGGVALVGVAAVGGIQFFTRRYTLALTLVGAVIIAVGLVTWGWPWTLDQMRAAAGAERYARPHPSAKLRSATLFVPPPANATGKASLHLAVDFSAADIAAGDDLAWVSWQATLRHGAQGRLALTQRWEPLFRGERDITEGRMKALTEGRGDQRGAWSGLFATKIDLPAAVVPRLRGGQASLVGEASGQLWRGWLEGLMPLRDGASVHQGMTATRLLRVVGPPTPVAEFGNFIEWAKASPFIAPNNLLARFHSATQPWNAYTHMLVQGRGVLVDLHPQWFWREGRPHELIEAPVGFVLFEGLVADFFPNTRDGHRQSAAGDPARFIDATVARIGFEETAHLTVPLEVPTLTPDLVIEGDLDVALRRAQAENKRVLVLVHRREFDPVAQTAPASWYFPEVRELLRSGFVCAQVFTTTDPRFRVPNSSQIYSNLVVLTADGAHQDTLSVPDVVQFWTLALRNAAQGGTYVDALRREFDRPGSKMTNGFLASALITRGDVAAGIELLLRAPPRSEDERRWREWWNMPGLTWDLAQWVISVPETRDVLHQQLDVAHAELQRDPRDTAAARRLFTITFALKEPGSWADFPRWLPKENPDHWRLLMAWIVRSNNREKIPLVPEAVEWDTFFHEGRRWVQGLLADARRDPQVDYPALTRHWRGNLLILGVQGVRVLAKAGEVERARALASEVQQVARFRDRTTRLALADALAGRPTSGYDPWADQR